VHPDKLGAARAFKPIHEREGFGRTILLFYGADPRQLSALGDVHTPSIADLFVAIVGDHARSATATAAGQQTTRPPSPQGAAR
jgi:ABC-2 type transport system ATP-binding protein